MATVSGSHQRRKRRRVLCGVGAVSVAVDSAGGVRRRSREPGRLAATRRSPDNRHMFYPHAPVQCTP